MNRTLIISLIIAFLFGSAFALIHTEKSNISKAVDQPAQTTEWTFNATAIEACSCPMFCQCYFNTEPASHGHEHGEEKHYCKFNVGWKVNEGHYGNTDLEGVVFWFAGDLGPSFGDGNVDWAVVHFDPSVTEAQREGILTVLDVLAPVQWQSFEVKEDKPIKWRADTQEAVALLGNGNAAEVHLIHPPTAMTDDQVLLTNIQYWGAPRHDGIVLMPNESQAYRLGDKAFETIGTNGFMITVDMNSGDVFE